MSCVFDLPPRRRPGLQYNQSGPASKSSAAAAAGRTLWLGGFWCWRAVVLSVLGMVFISGASADMVFQTRQVKILYDPGLKSRAAQIAEMSPAIIRSLENKLGLPFNFQPTIIPAPDRAAFRRLGGREWFTAFAVPRRQLVVLDLSRLDKQSGDLHATLKHELAHLLLHQAIDAQRLPRWLDEGVAQWASDGLSEYLPAVQRSLLPQAASAGRLLYLEELTVQFPATHQGCQLAYEQSRSFVNYLVRRFGEDALRLLLQSLAAGAAPWEAFEEALGVGLDTTEDEWRAGLHSPGSWMANLAGHIYGLLFFLAAVATVGAYLRFRHRKRHYRAGEDDDPDW